MTIKNMNISSDVIGAFSSGLCLVHCLATPFIFIAQSCSTSCCADAPFEWMLLDYIFVVISFVAVYYSARDTKIPWIRFAMWMAWVATFAVILNEKWLWLPLSNYVIYVPAVALIGLHIYNRKYCRRCGPMASCTA